MSRTDRIDRQISEYYEQLAPARRDLVWVRFTRIAGAPITDFDERDPYIDEVFDQVLTDMWCADHLDKLVQLGRLTRTVTDDGAWLYQSP